MQKCIYFHAFPPLSRIFHFQQSNALVYENRAATKSDGKTAAAALDARRSL
jgi:hypothetical protein